MDDHVLDGVSPGLGVMLGFPCGFWFGSLSDDATLASYLPRPTPTTIPTPGPGCYRGSFGGVLKTSYNSCTVIPTMQDDHSDHAR